MNLEFLPLAILTILLVALALVIDWVYP